MKKEAKIIVFVAVLLMAVLYLTGCSNIGPKTVPRDRFNYNTAITNSWKEQTLLNVVRLRYADMPLFVDVASVVSGYTLEGSVNIGGTVSSEKAIQGDFLSLGTAGKFTDRPTITYAPITGQRFNKSFMTPIPPQAILFLMQSGWPIDLVFPLTVDAVNGLRSRVAAGSSQRAGDPAFYRVISLLREIQKSGAVGMRIVKDSDQKETTVMFFHQKSMSPEIEAALKEVHELLGLNPERQELTVTYGLIPSNDREIAMLTRSMLHIMVELATQIHVPSQHVSEGRTVPSLVAPDSAEEKVGQLINIRSSVDKPDNFHAAVNYKDHWFWIDDMDFKSKRTFTFLMILFATTEGGEKGGLPLVTIPAG
jgi:hypothetical protein